MHCCQSLSVVTLDATFKPHRAHDQAYISPPVIVLHSAALQDRQRELDRCRKLHVERALFLRRSLCRLWLVSLSGQAASGNTFGIKMPEQGSMKRTAKERQPGQQVLVPTFVQLECFGKRQG